MMMSDTARLEWRENWKVVLGTFLAMGLGYGGWSFTQSQFIGPLEQAFGWSRGQIAFAFHFSFFTSFVAPLFGRLIDRIGVRPVLSTCLALVALAYVLIANTGGNYTMFLVAFVLLVTAGLGTTGIAFTRAVAGRFSDSRGTALAISRIGYSLCGAFMPIVVFHTIANYGWQSGFYLMAGAAFLIALPVVLLLVSDKREAAELDAKGKPTPLLDLKLWGKLLSNRRILLVCLAAAFTYGPVIGIMSQLQPLLTGKGLAPEIAAEFGALLAISVVAGTLTTGLLVDRIWAPAVGCVFTLMPVVGIMFLLPEAPTIWMAGIGLVLIGLAQGAEIDVVAYIIARYFGMKAFAAIYGLSVLFIGVATSIGAMGFGFAFDHFGSYNQALMVAGGFFATGALCYLFLGRYPKEPSLEH